MTTNDLTKEQLLEMIENFEHYPSVTDKDDKAYILAYLEDESCSIGKDEIQKYIDENFSKIFESCPRCTNEVKLESKFAAQVCSSCNTIILPCSICPVNDNCLNCPLSHSHSEEDVYNKHFNKMLEGTRYTACFVETSELYGEDDDELDEHPCYMMPMYEAHIEDENEDEVENTCTGRYCDPSSVADELEGFINELINDTSKTNRVIQEIETLTGEDYDSLDIEKFEKFLSANHHLIKEISYTLGFIQSSIEISKLELDDKLKSFSDLLHEKFDRF